MQRNKPWNRSVTQQTNHLITKLQVENSFLRNSRGSSAAFEVFERVTAASLLNRRSEAGIWRCKLLSTRLLCFNFAHRCIQLFFSVLTEVNASKPRTQLAIARMIWLMMMMYCSWMNKSHNVQIHRWSIVQWIFRMHPWNWNNVTLSDTENVGHRFLLPLSPRSTTLHFCKAQHIRASPPFAVQRTRLLWTFASGEPVSRVKLNNLSRQASQNPRRQFFSRESLGGKAR